MGISQSVHIQAEDNQGDSYLLTLTRLIGTNG